MTRGKLTDIFLLERYEKEIKYIKVYDKYTPNYNRPKRTPKFYSKYEGGDLGVVDPEILKNLNHAKLSQREKLEWPETSNQTYGWWTTSFIDVDRSDPRFYFPRIGNEITTIGLKILQEKNSRKK